MHNKPRQDTQRIAEEAAEWLSLLAENGNTHHASFAEWLRASPRHAEEYLLMKALDEESRHIDPHKRIDVDELLGGGAANVVPLQSNVDRSIERLPDSMDLVPPLPLAANRTPTKTALPHRQRRSGRRWLAAAAVIAALAIALGWLQTNLGWEEYSTSIGEQRAVELADGSLVHLNTQSRVQVRLSKDGRDLRLLDGEALFKVARDMRRPFRVRVDATVIRALGTQFNVDRRRAAVRVSVLEGRVELSALQLAQNTRHTGEPGFREVLSAGEEIQVARNSAAPQVQRKRDITEMAAWRQRRLVFRDSPLADIAAEFNRYNRAPKIVIEGETANQRRFGGSFDADDPDSLIDMLRPDAALSIVRQDDTVIVKAK